MTTTAGTEQAARPRRRGRPRDEGADGRILAAAAALMLERGADDVTVEEVAEAAGVGKATVYRRFPSKDALVATALANLLGQHMPVPDTGSFAGDLLAAYRDTIAFARSEKGQAFLRLSTSAACRSARAADLYREAYERRIGAFSALIDRAIDRGELTRDLTDRRGFLDALPALLTVRAVTRSPLPAVDDAPRLLRQMLAGHLDPADLRRIDTLLDAR